MPVYENPNFRDLSGDLDRLFTSAAEHSFFAQSGWYDLIARYALPAGAMPRLYVAASGEATAALACAAEADGRRSLRSLANFYSCEHGIVAPGGEGIGAAVATIVDAIQTESPSWDVVRLTGFPADDPGFAALAAGLRRAGLSVQLFFDSGTWYEATTGISFAQYLAALPSALRNTWRRKSARLARTGRARWHFYDSPDGIDRAIADYQTVYGASWKDAEPFPDFMPALIRFAAARGALRLGTLHLDDQPVAAQFWIVWRGRACIYKLAHRSALDELSPGTLLTMRMMEWVLDRDHPREINFGRGDDVYKRQWLSRRRERWSLEAANWRTVGGVPFALRHAAARLARPFRRSPLVS